jgi:SPP1 gp7 family putative phage head morphogenesis protein
MTQNLEQEVTKALLYLERVQPDSALILEENLLQAQKNILAGIANTTNQKKIRTLVNKEMSLAFEDLDEAVIEDMRDIAGTTWDKMGSIMADGFVTTQAAKAFTKFKDISKEAKARLTNKNMLIQGHTLDKHFKHLNSTSTAKVQGIIINGFDKGQGIAEIGRNVRNTIGATYRNQANTLIRTSMLENIEAVKNESWKEFEDEIDGYKFSAVMDTRTSKYCFLHNGYITKEQAAAKYRPKTHYNCRSVWIPQNDLIREFDKLNPDKNIVQWNGKKVNHRDGTKSTKFKVGEVKQVAKGSTPETFFKSFDDKYQREYLGAKRYELWKDGKMSFKDAMNVSRKKLLAKDKVNLLLLNK